MRELQGSRKRATANYGNGGLAEGYSFDQDEADVFEDSRSHRSSASSRTHAAEDGAARGDGDGGGADSDDGGRGLPPASSELKGDWRFHVHRMQYLKAAQARPFGSVCVGRQCWAMASARSAHAYPVYAPTTVMLNRGSMARRRR